MSPRLRVQVGAKSFSSPDLWSSQCSWVAAHPVRLDVLCAHFQSTLVSLDWRRLQRAVDGQSVRLGESRGLGAGLLHSCLQPSQACRLRLLPSKVTAAARLSRGLKDTDVCAFLSAYHDEHGVLSPCRLRLAASFGKLHTCSRTVFVEQRPDGLGLPSVSGQGLISISKVRPSKVLAAPALVHTGCP